MANIWRLTPSDHPQCTVCGVVVVEFWRCFEHVHQAPVPDALPTDVHAPAPGIDQGAAKRALWHFRKLGNRIDKMKRRAGRE